MGKIAGDLLFGQKRNPYDFLTHPAEKANLIPIKCYNRLEL